MSLPGIIFMLVFGANVVLTWTVGLCPALLVVRSRDAARLGLVMTLAVTVSSVVAWVLNQALVPLGATYLRTIVLVLVAGGSVAALNTVFRRFLPGLYRLVGTYFSLVTTNCAVVGVTFVAFRADARFAEALVAGAAGGAGFLLAVLLLTTIRSQLATERVPPFFRGTPIVLISAGLVALAFLAFDRVLLANLFH